jgi:signal transduction histidine kinase/outer membrane murein-binding lipoprotein Lpp
MKRPTFRLKIALLSAIISGAVMVAFGWAALAIVSQQKIDSLDTRIRSLASRQPGWLSQRRDYPRFEEALEFVFGGDAHDPAILLVLDADGGLVYRSAGWPEELDPAAFKRPLRDDPKAVAEGAAGAHGEGFGGPGPGGGRGLGPGGGKPVRYTKIPEFQTARTRAGRWRIGRLGTDDTTLVIGLSFKAAEAEINHVRRLFLLALPLALAAVALGGWIVAGRALRPLRVIADTAARVTSRGLDQRIPLSGEDPEIDRLSTMLNRMMDRLEAGFQQATRFTADASHELKTPLAILCGELENALQTAKPGSPEQQTFSGLLEETQRFGRIISSLLLLSRADAGQLVPALEPVDLNLLLREVLEDTAVLAEDAHLELQTEPLPEVTVSADPALLRLALLNLLTNAVKYNEPGGVIRVSAELAGDGVVLRIGNSGPGIPADDQPRVFSRFHRANRGLAQRVDGIGLGLSLTREILHAHRATVELKESRRGWTLFEVRMAGWNSSGHSKLL